jgi:hypothetical protein
VRAPGRRESSSDESLPTSRALSFDMSVRPLAKRTQRISSGRREGLLVLTEYLGGRGGGGGGGKCGETERLSKQGIYMKGAASGYEGASIYQITPDLSRVIR